MPYRTSRKNGMSRRRTALKPYPGGQTRRQTEEHGDLNVYNRMYQFYNYHADKDILIDEMCRGLILSLLRISGGTVQEYDEPLGWTAPFHQAHCAHHDAIVFHMKDQRRHSATFAKTLSSFSGQDMAVSPLPAQYDADVKVSHTAVPTWVQLHKASGEMKSMAELAAELASCIKIWIEAQTFGGAEDGEEAVRGLDLVPSRLQLLKRCVVSNQTSYEIVVDDREFDASKVDVAAYTTVTMQNVTPASGDSLMTGDPLSSDTINHVPLKGKMYTFSGPVPKVWDRHRAELQHLFRPSFFEKGRYLLPNSKLHDETMDDFRTFPRGRHIWSNCVAEDRITFQPGSSQKLKLEYRMKTSVRDFFHKFRNDDISSSKLGRCVCLALEPQIRRQHVGQPISAVLPKRLWRDGVVNSAVQYEPYMWAETPEIGPGGLSTGRKVITKVVRQVFTLDTSVVPTESNTNPATAELWWTDGTIAVKTPGGVTTSPSSSMEPLKWDSITRGMLDSHPQLAHFVSKGDPIMFNVQINRLYTASSLLKNYTRLGADKTGVKRKHEDKMYSNMGDVSFARAQQLGDVYKDHNLQSATTVGVAPLILEGDDKNTMVTVNVNAEQQAFQNALMAMDADTAKDGLQLDVVGNALAALDEAIDTDGLKVHGSVATTADTGLATAVGGLSTAITGVPGVSTGIVGALQANATAVTQVAEAGNAVAEAGNAVAESGVAVAEAGNAVAASGVTMAGSILDASVNIGIAGGLIAGATTALETFGTPNVTVQPADVNVTMPSSMAVTMSAIERDALAGRIADQISDETLRVKTLGSNTVSIAIPHLEAAALAEDIAEKISETTLQTKLAGNVDNTTTSVDVTVPTPPSAAEIAESIYEKQGTWRTGTIVSSNGSTSIHDAWTARMDDGQMFTGYLGVPGYTGFWYPGNQSPLPPGGRSVIGARVVMTNTQVADWRGFGGGYNSMNYQGFDQIDIGQAISVEIPADQISVQATLPDTVNVTGTVDIGNTPTVDIGNTVDTGTQLGTIVSTGSDAGQGTGTVKVILDSGEAVQITGNGTQVPVVPWAVVGDRVLYDVSLGYPRLIRLNIDRSS
jgi:hypothetical protein